MSKIAIEVDETEYQNQLRLTQLYGSMMQNPKSRDFLTQAAKIVNPNAVTPELDAKQEVYAEIAKRDEQIAALQAQFAADKAARAEAEQLAAFQQTWQQKQSGLRKMGYTDEGIAKIEQLAQERGIADLDAAAALFDRLNPPQTVAQSSGLAPFDTFNISDRDNENFKKLLAAGGDGDPMVENDMIREAISDFRSGRAR